MRLAFDFSNLNHHQLILQYPCNLHCRFKKDIKLLGSILKRRIAREKEDKAAKAKLEEAKLHVSPNESNEAEQRVLFFEQQLSQAFGSVPDTEPSDGFLESVDVIHPVSQLEEVTFQLQGTPVEDAIQTALGCMSASLGYTEKQRYSMIFSQFVESGMVEALVRSTHSCERNLLCTLLHVVGHHQDIHVASQAKIALSKIWKLLYFGRKKPSHLPDALVRIEIGTLPGFKLLHNELVANGCQMTCLNKEETVKNTQGYSNRNRIHFIRLILDSITDYCNFLKNTRCHLDNKEVGDALELLNLVLCMRYDTNSFRILESLDAVLLALIEALDDATWKTRLSNISYSLATSFSMDTPKALKLKVIRELPCGFRIFSSGAVKLLKHRCTELQQYAAALLLDVILEPLNSTKLPLSAIVATYPMDIEARISSADWFAKPSILTDCSGGETEVINHFTRVEMLLRLSDMLLWPCILTAMNTPKAPITYLSVDFLKRWSSFLGTVQRRIRTLNPEEQAVKARANFLKLQYDTYLEDFCNA